MILVPATMVRFSSHRGIFFVLSLYAFAASVVAASSSLSEKPIEKKAYNNHDDYYEPTMFTMQELAQGTRPDDLLLALQTSGMIAIAHDDEEDENANDNFSATATVALDQWCQCNDHFRHNNDHNHDDITKHIPSTQVIALEPNGGTTRTTLATATVGNENPLALDAHVADVCGVTAATQLDALRDVVHEASVAFVQALDDLILGGGNGGGIGSKNNNYLSLLRDVHGKTYPTVQSIVQAATHLEHYHLYEKQKKQDESMLKTKDDDDKKTKTLDFHTDAGLFLAFVPGYDCDATDMTTSSTLDNFWIRLKGDDEPTEYPVRFAPPQRTRAVIMLGAGAARWLHNVPSHVQLHATQHAVQLRSGQRRAWYGKSKSWLVFVCLCKECAWYAVQLVTWLSSPKQQPVKAFAWFWRSNNFFCCLCCVTFCVLESLLMKFIVWLFRFPPKFYSTPKFSALGTRRCDCTNRTHDTNLCQSQE